MRIPALRWTVAAVVVTAVAACGGRAGSTAAPAGTTPTGAAGASASATAPASGAATTAATPATGGTRPSSAGPGASAPTTGGSSTATTAGTPGTRSSTSSSAFPAPGHYTYDLSGTATTPLGKQDVSGTSDLTVDPAQGDRQHSIDQDRNGSTEQTIVVRPTGVYLADLHIAQQGFDEDFRPVTAALILPAHPRAGQSWSWRMTSTDGKYTMRATLTVASTDDAATVGGRRVHTVGVKTHSVVTGNQIDMTIDQRDEAARGLPVVTEHAVIDGTAYGASFHSDTTRRLASATPH